VALDKKDTTRTGRPQTVDWGREKKELKEALTGSDWGKVNLNEGPIQVLKEEVE